MSSTRRTMVAVLASLLFPAIAPAQSAPDSAMFAIRIGQDTSRYMWMIRDGDRLTTVSANRIPSLRVLRGETILDSDGSVEWLEQLVYEPADHRTAAPIAGVRIRTEGDATLVTYGIQPDSRVLSYAGRGHFINTSHYYEALVTLGSHPPAAVGDSMAGQHYAGTLFPQQQLIVRRAAPDLVTVWSRPLGTVNIRLADGEVVEFDGAGTSALNFTGTRMPWRDIDTTVAEMLAQEQAGKRFGSLSPLDSVRAEIAGARVAIDYYRPYQRGRQIFGYIVPWDVVWRTGANRATAFSTDRDLLFGDSLLPAGEYTIWTLPSQRGWTLIFNSQTGQWGTEYDADHDVVRVPMQVTALNTPIEQLSLLLEPQGEGGVLRVLWENTGVSAAFTVRD